MLTQERLKYLLHYGPETGVFTRKITVNNKKGHAGDIAGCFKNGYIKIRVDNKPYQAHRLAWLYMTGKFPQCQIDHRDLDKANNRWSNLREATYYENGWNTAKTKRNTSGVKGVSWCKRSKKWLAQMAINGRNTNLGIYKTKSAAKAAYDLAAYLYRGEYARGE